MDKVLLVSGDGDYCRMVKFLIEENYFATILYLERAIFMVFSRINANLSGCNVTPSGSLHRLY
jgi:hypothetical protein